MAWHDSTIVSAAVPAADQQGDLNMDRAPRLKPPPQSKGRVVKSKGIKRPYKAMTVDGDDEEEDSNHVVEEEEEEDTSAHPAGAEVKKRVRKGRLSTEQLNFLEMSFEEENKLEPHRKALIAKHLGLVPRQVAIWFQNRRARWKNKQLEQAYLDLSARHDSALKEKEDLIKRNDEVMQENKRLQEEVARLLAIIQAAKHSSEVSKGAAAVNSSNAGDLVQCSDSSSENTASTCDQVMFKDTTDKEEQQGVTIGSQPCRSGLPENSCDAHGSDQSCICSEISFFELPDPSQPIIEIEDLKTFYGEEVVNGNLLSYHSLFQLQAGVFLEDAYTVLVDPSVGLLWYD